MKTIKAPAKFLVVFLFLLGLHNVLSAQQIPNSLTEKLGDKIALYGVKMQSPALFIHFDKNVYTNNENVWFTAYFLNIANQKAYKVLSVALVRDDDHLLVFNEKFIVSNGLAFGNTVIPDTTAAGHYSFIAYSNRLVNGKPDVLFTQRITIKRDAQTGYNASLNPLDTGLVSPHQKVMLLVTGNDPKKPVSKIPIAYYLGNSAHPALKGEAKLTSTGQYIFDIPSNLVRQGENRLHVRVNQTGEVKDLNIDLPAQAQPAVVGFFPEGGNLVAGLKNRVAWEVKTNAGQGLATDAILYENRKLIDTVHTNSYGFGQFILTPKANAVYSVKLFGVSKKDTVYQLPASVSHIPTLSVPKAVVNNALTVELNTDKPQLVYLNLHNYAQLFSSTPINLNTGEKKVSILLNDMPKGLTQITLTDSSGHPLAERLFFAHYDKKPGLQIKTDKSSYKSREKVTVSLKLDNIGLLDSGLVSIACVQENRLSINNKNDIESYFYLKHQLGDLPVKENYLGAEDGDKSFLEDVLLIKGWSRYTWLDMLKVTPTDTVIKQSELVFKGLVTSYDSNIKKPVDVINFNHPLNTITTDSAGNFNLPNNNLMVQRNKKLRFFVNNDRRGIYQIKTIDPYRPVTDRLIAYFDFRDSDLPQQFNTQMLEMTGFNRAINLKEVKIKGNKNDDPFHGFGANACGDYVCRFNILNCPNHRDAFDNVPPVVGKSYNINGVFAIYKGCEKELEHQGLLLSAIYAAQEFYPSDLSQPDSPPEYLSTLYWKYFAKITSSDRVEFSFYTNDIAGRFKIIVQGRTAKEMIYGEESFEVAKPK